MDITINGNINFSGNDLLDNEATFRDLISLLKKNQNLTNVIKPEEEEQFTRMGRRPGAIQLREHYDRIAMIPVGDGCCEVFSNGYAVFDNGDRKTVVWVPACGIKTYRFTRLTDRELEYQQDQESLDEELMGDLPWYYPIIMAGEDRIEWNLAHPRSAGNMSDADLLIENQAGEACCWCSSSCFPNPEEAYIQKETKAERRAMLTDKQLEVYDMYFDDCMTQCEIADRLGISQKAVDYRLDGIEKKMKKYF